MTEFRQLRKVVEHNYIYPASLEFSALLCDKNDKVEVERLFDNLNQKRFIRFSIWGLGRWDMRITPRHWESLISSCDVEQLHATWPVQHFIQQILMRIKAVGRGGYD